MKISILIFLFFLILNCSVFPQIFINEIQTSNKSTLADEDGDYEDWVELYNAGNVSVNLSQYGLSDDKSDKFRWRFPVRMIESKGFLLVYASGKNRIPNVNHWETAVFAQDVWRYFVGTQNPPTGWNQPGFNSSAWLSGAGGIGYGDNDDGTVIQQAISVFMRREFNVSDASVISSALLSMDYDDGFVAYLNGTEIARANLPGTPPDFNTLTTTDHEAKMYLGGTPDHFELDQALLKSLLVNGTNVLAIEVHNSSPTSSDLSAIPFLSFGIINSNTVIQPVPAWFPKSAGSNLHANFKLKHSGESILLTAPSGTVVDEYLIPYSDLDHSFCRIPDGAPSWCIARFVTPMESNNNSLCYPGYSPSPTMSISPGFYYAGQMITLKSPDPASEIHYTTDGSMPMAEDPLYTVPVAVNTTSVLRARCFGPSGLLPGKVATCTYIIGNLSYKFPVVSISMEPADLWDYYSGIYVKGPNAQTEMPYYGANYWQPWEKDCHIEYFSPMGPKKFGFDAALDIHGGWTRILDQKSFNIKTHSYCDSSEIKYKLFGDKPITEFKSFVLRNAGNDWMNVHMRDALMQRVMRNTFVDYSAYCPSVVYLNGQYWGIYNIRERTTRDYIEENHGINADSLDLIESDGMVSAGDASAFWQMVDYIKTHDLSVSQNYQEAGSMWNIPNFADYFIAETYYVNNDWIGEWTNNIKLWRQRKPGSKWNYILWDTDFGLGQTSNYNENKLAQAMNPKMSTPHAIIFKKFLDNPDFRKYFINRYADLINTVFLPANINSELKKMQDSIATEIPVAWKRWFGYAYSQQWLNNISNMKTFISNRPGYALDYINSTFSLQGRVNIQLSAMPAGSGEIKINTIVPGPLPWTGTYFNGNPVTITAIAKPGYKFLYWSTNSYFAEDANRSLTFNPDHFDIFTAVFSENPEAGSATISEVNYHSDSTSNSGDWLEIHNSGSGPLDISDWHITDSQVYNDYIFPAGTVLPANGYLVVAEDASLFSFRYPGVLFTGPLGFGLNNKKESVSLLDPNRNIIVSFTYYDSIPWLEAADGIGRTLELRSGSSNPDDPASWFVGCMGGSPGQPYQPCDDKVVFSEINYNSAVSADAGDWVELFNPGTAALDVSGWKFSDSDNLHLFQIPTGTLIQAGEYLVLYGDKLKFESSFPSVANKIGPFVFGLSGSGEAIRLFDNTGKLAFAMVYDDDPPWPKEPDGQGYTLELADVHGIMCEGTNWYAGCPGGSPGRPYVFPCGVGIDEFSGRSFTVFPNPAASYLFILQNEKTYDRINVQIIDALGRIVFEKQVFSDAGSKSMITLEGVKNGIYLLRIITGINQPAQVVRIVVAR